MPLTSTNSKIVKCAECGSMFEVGRRRLLCSQSCSNRRKNRSASQRRLRQYRANADYRARKIDRNRRARGGDTSRPIPEIRFGERSCEHCGTIFTPDGQYAADKYCSTVCRDRSWWTTKYRRRKAAHQERYQDVDIFIRDSWMCGLCGERIDALLSHPDPRSASIDHVVPISRGGADAPGNVQAAHLVCNLKKGNRA